MSYFIHTFLYAFIAIFPVANPIAMSSVFYSMTRHAKKEERILVSQKVGIYGISLLLAVLLVGPFVLLFFGLHATDIRVAGGLIVFSIAWNMLNKTDDRASEIKGNATDSDILSLAFFPLTMPLTAGAGSIAVVVVLAMQAQTMKHVISHYLAIALAITVTFIIVSLCFRYADAIFNSLGKTGGKVVTSLAAFILLAMGVSITWGGIHQLIMSIH